MPRLPTVFQNKNHDLAKSAQAQWAGDIANALNRARVRRHAVKMQQEAGKIDGDDAASRNLCGRIKLLDEVRAILDEVPVEERYHEWMERDGWVREQKKSLNNDDAQIDDPEARRIKLLVELGAPVGAMKPGQHSGLDEGIGTLCESDGDYTDLEDGLSDSEFEEVYGSDTDEEGGRRRNAVKQELEHTLKKVVASKEAAAARWAAENPHRIDTDGKMLDGVVETVEMCEEGSSIIRDVRSDTQLWLPSAKSPKSGSHTAESVEWLDEELGVVSPGKGRVAGEEVEWVGGVGIIHE